MLGTILVVAAFILALLEAFSPWFWATTARPHLGWLSLALFFASLLAGHL